MATTARSEDTRVVRSACRMCHGVCQVLVHLRGGRVLKVTGDPDSPTSRGYICPKGAASPDRQARRRKVAANLLGRGAQRDCGSLFPDQARERSRICGDWPRDGPTVYRFHPAVCQRLRYAELCCSGSPLLYAACIRQHHYSRAASDHRCLRVRWQPSGLCRYLGLQHYCIGCGRRHVRQTD